MKEYDCNATVFIRRLKGKFSSLRAHFQWCLLAFLSMVPILASSQPGGCIQPVNPQVDRVNDNAAVVRWEGSRQDVRLRWNIVNDNVYHYDTVNSNYYFITGLSPVTDYEVEITSGCNSNFRFARSFRTTESGLIGDQNYVIDMPFSPYCSYSISEQLWLSSELTAIGDTIRGVSFLASDPSAYPRNIKLWIDTTTLSSLTTSQYLPSTSMTLVFDDTITIRAGLNLFSFSTPFVRNASRNIVILAADNSGTTDDYCSFIGGASSVSSLSDCSFSTPLSTTNLSTLYGSNYRAAVIFDASAGVGQCKAPMVGVDMNGSDALVSWIPGGEDTMWTVEYRLAGSSAWTTVVDSTISTSALIPYLPPSTRCQVRVGSLAANEVLYDTMQTYTTCGTIQLPYYEDVAPVGGYGCFNPCWYGISDTINSFNYLSAQSYLGLNGGGLLITPELPVDANQVQLTFDWNAQSSSTSAIVGVCPHANDLDSMQIIDTLRYSRAGYVEQAVNFADANPSYRHIFIRTQGYHSMFDNFSIIDIPSCLPPDSLWVDSMVGHDVYLAWHPSSEVADYTVTYSLAGSDSTISVTTTDTTVALLGLQPRSTYTASISVSCTSGITPIHPSSTLVFNTSCEAVSNFPYTEDFENCILTDTHTLPHCWHERYATTESGTALNNKVVNNPSYASSGSHCLYLMRSGITILPEMGVDVSTLSISFNDCNPNPGIYYLVLGVCDSNTAGCEASFVPLDTIWQLRNRERITSHALSNYTGTGRYIAIQNRSDVVQDLTGEYSNHYIDDITIDYLPSCLAPRRLNAHVSPGSPVSLSWSDFGSPTEWEVSYSSTPMDDPLLGTRTMVYSNPALLPDLPGGTLYFYVRSVCAPGDTSIWSAPDSTIAPFCTSVEEYCNLNTTSHLYASRVFPCNELFNYSYSQMLLDSAEMAHAGGQIAGFRFKPDTASSDPILSDLCYVYMTNTPLTSLEHSFATVDETNDLVASDVNLGGTDTAWRFCLFDTPFVWDGHSSVAITVNRKAGLWSRNCGFFRMMDNTDYKVRYSARDDSAYHHAPAANTGWGFHATPVVTLVSCNAPEDCLAPVIDTIITTDHSAELTLADSLTLAIAIRSSASEPWSREVMTTGISYTLDNLAHSTHYELRLRQVCDASMGRFSDCIVTSFTTATPSFAVNVVIEPEGAGTVTGARSYYLGDTCRLTAVANEGFVFSGWGDGVLDNPRELIVVSETTLVAMFSSQQAISSCQAEPVYHIYPNPSDGDVFIKTPGISGPIKVEVVNIQGRVITAQSTTSTQTLRVEHLAPGTYLIRIMTDTSVYTHKIVVH